MPAPGSRPRRWPAHERNRNARVRAVRRRAAVRAVSRAAPVRATRVAVIFGREVMTGEAIRRLLAQNLLVVHGNSGCGKSSLIRAGVLVAAGATPRPRRPALADLHDAAARSAAAADSPQTLARLKASKPAAHLIREIRRALNAGRGAAASSMSSSASILAIACASWSTSSKSCFVSLRRPAPTRRGCSLMSWWDCSRKRSDGASRKPTACACYAILTMRSDFLGACASFEGSRRR